MIFRNRKTERVLKNCIITPSGKCIINYVNRLLNGQDDYIQAYENFINELMRKIDKDRITTLKIVSEIGEKLESMVK